MKGWIADDFQPQKHRFIHMLECIAESHQKSYFEYDLLNYMINKVTLLNHSKSIPERKRFQKFPDMLGFGIFLTLKEPF